MNVKQRLKLLAILSIVAIVSLTLANVYKEYLYVNKLKKMEGLVSFSEQISSVMNEIQSERSISSVYIQSRGEFLVSELDDQRKLTDSSVALFYNMLKEEYHGLSKEVMQSDISKVDGLLQELSTIRNKIDRFKLPQIEMLAFYEAVNIHILRIIAINADQSPSGDISKDLNAYYFFLKAKEIASKQKAILSAAFISEKFSEDILEQTIALIAKEQSYLDVFENLAPLELVDIYKTEENREVFQDSYDISQSAMSNLNDGSFDLESWFGMISKKDDIFKEIDKKALSKISEDIKQTPSIALYSVIVGVIFLFFILFVIIGINKEISKRIHSFDWIV